VTGLDKLLGCSNNNNNKLIFLHLQVIDDFVADLSKHIEDVERYVVDDAVYCFHNGRAYE